MDGLLGAALIVGSVFAVVRRETALPGEEGGPEPRSGRQSQLASVRLWCR